MVRQVAEGEFTSRKLWDHNGLLTHTAVVIPQFTTGLSFEAKGVLGAHSHEHVHQRVDLTNEMAETS